MGAHQLASPRLYRNIHRRNLTFDLSSAIAQRDELRRLLYFLADTFRQTLINQVIGKRRH